MIIKRIKNNAHKGSSLKKRLLVLFIALLTISIIITGLSSYSIARETTIHSIESRLIRETELMSYIADNLKFLYISDDDYFMQQLELNVRKQKEKLAMDGITSDYFYIIDQEIVPFQISKNNLPNIPGSFISKIAESERGTLHQDINGNDYTFTFVEMEEIGGTFVLIVPTASYMGSVHTMAYLMIVIMIISIFIATITILFVVRGISQPLHVLREKMRAVRDGDLREDSSCIKTNIPEIASLHKSYQVMMEYLRSLFHQITEITTHLEKTGHELQYASNGTLASSRDLITAIHNVKIGAEQTASSSEGSANSFQLMKENIVQLIARMEAIFQNAQDMTSSARQSDKNMTELIHMLASFRDDFAQLTTSINDIDDYSKSIHQFAGLIQGIAEQTKLLSLNATIEAAHAGESGKGFAVVAREVGKLAEQSSIAADKITTSIKNMDVISKTAVDAFHKILHKTNKTMDQSTEAKQEVDNLLQDIYMLSEGLQDVQGELKQLELYLPPLETETLRFQSISQETLASAEEMLASSENQINQVENTHRIGLQLIDISKKLTDSTKQFTIQ